VTQCWRELEALINAQSVTFVIIDAELYRQLQVQRVPELIERYSAVFFVLYAPITAECMKAVLELSRRGLKGVITPDDVDSPIKWRTKLEQWEWSLIARTTYREILPSLAYLPPDVATTIESLFQTPQQYQSALDLARKAALSLRCLYRSFEVAQLRSPKDFLVAARAWHAFA
jgi:hypothetical protein